MVLQSRILFFEHLNSPESLAAEGSGLHIHIETRQTSALSSTNDRQRTLFSFAAPIFRRNLPDPRDLGERENGL
jgi:hypothetical protein